MSESVRNGRDAATAAASAAGTEAASAGVTPAGTTDAFEGFSERYADFPDYILKITRDIWEGRAIGSLRETYAEDILMRFPGGIVRGNRGTMDGTLATLHEFPDRTLLGEDVIWSGNARDGHLSSHRVLSIAHHTGEGQFSALLGPPTGKRLRMRAIADCAARNDVIYDEWLIRDTGGVVRQLGGDAATFARDLIGLEGGPERCARPLTPENDEPGPYVARGNRSEWGERYAAILTDIMADDLDVIGRSYDRACSLEMPGHRFGTSWGDAERFWIGLRAAFPRAEFTIHHSIGREDPMLSPRAAIRWSLWGTHSGWGAFGPPTGAKVHVMGISHAEFGPWGLRREWTIYDEVAIWKQIHLAGMAREREAAAGAD